jgi:hypothetical protein
MSCCVCFSRQTACDRRRRELRSVGRCTMRGIEVLVKPGTHTRLAFDLYIPCMAKVIVSKGRREGRVPRGPPEALTRVTTERR